MTCDPLRSPEMSFRERGGWWVVGQFGLFGAVAVAAWIDGPEISGGEAWAVAVGGVLLVAGATLAALAFAALGFEVTIYPEPVEGSSLATGGVYRYARHPIYGGVILLFVGGMLLVDSAVGLMLAVCLVPFFWAKSSHEEQRLRRLHPEYGDYCDRVRRRLIPFVV